MFPHPTTSCTKRLVLLSVIASSLGLALPVTGVAQTTWSNNNATNSWTNPATWSSGVPTSATPVTLTATNSFIQIPAGFTAEAASVAMSNAAGSQSIDIQNGGRLSVSGAITDPGAGTARIFVANTNAADATNRLTATSLALGNLTLRNPGTTTNSLATDFNITASVQLLVGEFGSGGTASFAQNGGTINADTTGFGITIGEGLASTNIAGPLSYDLNAGTVEALRIGAGNGNGTGASGANRNLNASSYSFNFNAGTVQNRGSNSTLNIQNGFANDGVATNTMGWNTASPLQVRLSASGSNVFNANGASSLIIVSPSARVVDQTSGGTITKIGAGELVFAGGRTANSNTWTGPTTVSNGNVTVDYNRIAGQAATGGMDALANAYSPASQLVLAGGGFTLTGRGSASSGSLTNVTLSNNSTLVGVATTNGLVVGQAVTNANLPAGAYIRRLASATNIELSSFPTNTTSGQALDLGAASFANTQVINDVVLQAASNTITVNAGAGTSTTLLTFSNFSGTGGITKAGAGSLALAPGAGVTNTLTGNLAGTGTVGTIAKNGAGRVILAGTTNTGGNTFNGALVVNEGTLQIGNATNSNEAAQRLLNTLSGGATVFSGATLLFKNSSALSTTTPINLSGLLATDMTGVSGGGFFNVLGALTLSNGGELRANNGANASNFQSYALNGAVTVAGTNPSTITTQTNASVGDGIHLAVSNTVSARTFDVANVTGDANADLTVSARLINGSGTLSAVGLTKSGAGQMVLSGSNSYTGSTVVSNGQLELATNGWLRFAIGATGVNNSVSGAGSAFFRGNFLFDLAAAGTNTGDTWTIVSVTTPSYDGSFQVSGFTNSGGTWTRTTNGVTYQFVQATGVLSIPGAGPTNAYGQWLTNYPSLTGTNTNAAADPDGDGFANGSEFAFGGNPTVGSPALMAAQKSGTNANISFIAATNAVTYTVRTTTNLASGPWTNAAVTLSNSPDQSGVLLTNYVRRQFTVPASSNAFYKVEASY